MRSDRINEAHKAFIRTLPCICCGRVPTEYSPTEAAHCRLPWFGDVTVPFNERGGTGLKPHDKYINPLNRECHRRQGKNERGFWEGAGINPLESGPALYLNSGNRSACLGIIQRRRNGATEL